MANIWFEVALTLWGIGVVALVIGVVRARLKIKRPKWRGARVIALTDASSRRRRQIRRPARRPASPSERMQNRISVRERPAPRHLRAV